MYFSVSTYQAICSIVSFAKYGNPKWVKLAFLTLGTMHILDRIMLCHGAVLSTGGCLPESLNYNLR